jgi:hypothetical protein
LLEAEIGDRAREGFFEIGIQVLPERRGVAMSAISAPCATDPLLPARAPAGSSDAATNATARALLAVRPSKLSVPQ